MRALKETMDEKGFPLNSLISFYTSTGLLALTNCYLVAPTYHVIPCSYKEKRRLSYCLSHQSWRIHQRQCYKFVDVQHCINLVD